MVRVASALFAGVPLVATFWWLRWILGQIDRIEEEIRPLGGLAYATFVQLAYDWSNGAGWVQTVHRGYAEDWRWGGHYAPLLFVSSFLASFSASPWALARVQACAVGLGILVAWLLGRAEAGRAGALVGLALYAASAPVALLALADYQDMVFVLPLLPLAVWAARHAPWWGFVAAATLLGAVREECLLLLPLVGLAKGPRRAALGLLVTAAYLAFYASLGPSPYPNPLHDILTFQAGQLRARGLGAFPSFSPNLYGLMAGPGWPWLALAPDVALPAFAVAAFHAQDPTAVGSVQSPAIHHLAPLTAAALAAGIVGGCRLLKGAARLKYPRIATFLALSALAASTAWSWRTWQTPLLEYGLRARGTGPHPAWALLAQADPAAALLVPESVAPAAARRREVVTLDSLGDRVPPTHVHLALDEGRLQGTVLAESHGWRLLKDPVLPQQRAQGGIGGRQ